MSNIENETCVGNGTFIGVKVVAGISVFLGLCNILLGTLVVAFIFLHKRHHFHSQRLVLYLSVIVIVGGIKSTIDVHAFVSNSLDETTPFCAFLGLLHNYTDNTLTLAVFVITLDTFLLVTCNVDTSRLDILEVLFMFILPTLWIWIPLLPEFSAYGPDAAECNLILVNYTTCTAVQIGGTFGIFLIATPSVIIAVAMFILNSVNIVILNQSLNVFESRYDPQRRTDNLRKIKEAKYLFIYPVLYALFALINMVNRIIQYQIPGDNTVGVSLAVVLTLNIRNLSLLLTYTFKDHETCSDMRCRRIVAACIACFSRDDPVTDYTDAAYSEFGDSLASAMLEKRKSQEIKLLDNKT